MRLESKKVKDYFSKSIFSRKVTDAQFDNAVRNSIAPLYKRALDMNIMDRRDCIRQPKCIISPSFNNQSDVFFKIKRGEDNIIRYTPLRVTIINFTEHDLIIYECIFDLVTNRPLNEGTLNYFYNEVVSIETKTKTNTEKEFTFGEKVLNQIPLINSLFDTGKHNQYNVSQQLILTTRGSSSLVVPLSDFSVVEAIGGEFKTTDAMDAIRSVRTVLRSKKR